MFVHAVPLQGLSGCHQGVAFEPFLQLENSFLICKLSSAPTLLCRLSQAKPLILSALHAQHLARVSVLVLSYGIPSDC